MSLSAFATVSVLVASPGLSTQVLELQPATARPGDAVRVRVYGAPTTPSGELGGAPLTFFLYRGVFQAITGLPVETGPGAVEVRIHPGEGLDELVGTLDVVPPNFNQRPLTVENKYVAPPPKVKRWIAEDRAAFKRAFDQKPRGWLFGGSFAWPRRAEVTAPYGDLRVFNGKKQSQHFGTDIDGRIGEPVHAANDGRVVLVRECYSAGNAVVLHHGAALYTAYFHLSKFAVKQGQRVKKGQLLGEVGKTGRVTGPHLHWGVKVDDRWVDAESLLRLKLD
ncbi:MAG: M23 family metallopeptidase [Myxococcota bacterium]